VNNLQAIAILQNRLAPLGARHDFAVAFDSNAIAFHTKLLDQVGQRYRFPEAFRFTIDEELHGKTLAQADGGGNPAARQDLTPTGSISDPELPGECIQQYGPMVRIPHLLR
jgi:hypothetical protein